MPLRFPDSTRKPSTCELPVVNPRSAATSPGLFVERIVGWSSADDKGAVREALSLLVIALRPRRVRSSFETAIRAFGGAASVTRTPLWRSKLSKEYEVFCATAG